MKKKSVSVKKKMYIFVILTVLGAALGTAALAFLTSVSQIDQYYKRCAAGNAKTFTSLADGDFLWELRQTVVSDEYQELRGKAEEEGNDGLVRDYLQEHGLLDQFLAAQDTLACYMENMEDIKYLYLLVQFDKDSEYDMYLMDTPDDPLYQVGYYEEREAELKGQDVEKEAEPIISHGTWGWLCSAFCPVYNSAGDCVCVVGCDFGMDEVMNERFQLLVYLGLGTLLFTVIVQLVAMMIINRTVVNPLDAMTNEMKKFKPAEHISYEKAGVIDLPYKRDDEIGAIYQGIRTMQTNIIDHLNDLSALQEDKKKAEQDIKDKKKQIDQLSEENNRDTLTGVGSKSAYGRKVDELNEALAGETAEFALVMVDMNNLKMVNDKFGHKAGDRYIIGCCEMVLEAYRHSLLYRIGGDEFVVVVQGEDYPVRHEIFDRLKADFERTAGQEDRDPWFRYSAALGIAENAYGDSTVDLVFRRADKAMYEDKKRFKQSHGSYR